MAVASGRPEVAKTPGEVAVLIAADPGVDGPAVKVGGAGSEDAATSADEENP